MLGSDDYILHACGFDQLDPLVGVELNRFAYRDYFLCIFRTRNLLDPHHVFGITPEWLTVPLAAKR